MFPFDDVIMKAVLIGIDYHMSSEMTEWFAISAIMPHFMHYAHHRLSSDVVIQASIDPHRMSPII